MESAPVTCRTTPRLLCLALAATLLQWPAGEAAAQTAAQTKEQKEQAEAAEHYERGLVFFQQGAYPDAEKAFRQAERKDDRNLEYQLATAETYIRLHRPDDALKRYSKIYKKDPTHLRALAGMAASYDEMQNYREATRMWMRLVKMDLAPAQRDEAQRALERSQALFAERYEIAENPAGVAANAATAQQEQQWGLEFSRQLAASGIPEIPDRRISLYVLGLCERLVPVAKGFPRQYQLGVLDSATVNAQTTPGFIFVYRGLLETVTNEAELVGVLAHEMGHTIAHHSGKAVTKAVQNQETLARLKASKGGFSKFLAALVALGNPLGELSFSRDQEAQADRLGIHISYDAWYDPRALASLFQKFESMAPSSRKAWDRMTRTHPFSLGRLNAVNDYVPLLPQRPLMTSSPDFDRMKEQLRALLPSPEPVATTPAPANLPAGTPVSGDGAVIPFTVDNAPFAGEIPATWAARKTESGTVIFEGQKGTEAYQATVEMEIAPKTNLPNHTLADVGDIMVRGLSGKPNARVEMPELRTDGSRSMTPISRSATPRRPTARLSPSGASQTPRGSSSLPASTPRKPTGPRWPSTRRTGKSARSSTAPARAPARVKPRSAASRGSSSSSGRATASGR